MIRAKRKYLLTILAVLGVAALARSFVSPHRHVVAEYGSHIIANAEMPSAALGHPLAVTLYLPDSAALSSGPLPVIVLLHGVNSVGMDWVTKGQIQSTLDRLISSHRMPPVIVAMPSTGTSWYVDSADIGGPGNYETAVAVELPAWLADHWNARADRDGKAIAGYSMGAFGALHIAFRHPENWIATASLSGTFLTVVGHQASIPALNHRLIAGAFGTPYIPDRLLQASPVTLARSLRPREHLAPAVFIGCGTHDQLHLTAETNSMVDELHQLGIPVATDIIPGGHDWKTWKQLLPDALIFLGQHFDQKAHAERTVAATLAAPANTDQSGPGQATAPARPNVIP
jgi:S-formylglutathione hydrolase FrmB